MFEKKTILPVWKPEYVTIPEHCVLQSILISDYKKQVYFFYFFLGLVASRQVSMGLNLNFCYGDNYSLTDHFPAVDTYKVPDYMIKSVKSMKCLIHKALKENRYLYFCVDTSRISLYKKNKGIIGSHDIMLYGEDNKNYYVADFFDKHYSFDRCKKISVFNGYFSRKKRNLKGGFEGIYILKTLEKNDFSFDLLLITDLLNDYLQGRNSATRFLPLKRGSLIGYSMYAFGTEIYEFLKEYICTFSPDRYEVRSFHILYEHKRVIRNLIKYMNTLGVLYNCEGYLKASEKLIEKAFVVRTLVIKSSVSGKDNKNVICEKLDELKNEEINLFTNLISEINDDKPSENKKCGKCKFIGYDWDTKGKWQERYGKDGYTIFGIENKDDPELEIRYVGMSDKVWALNNIKDEAVVFKLNDNTKWLSCKYFMKNAKIKINVKSERSKRIAIYCCDIYGIERDITFSAENEIGEKDIRIVRYKDTGVYLLYEVTGNVCLDLVNNNASICPISAIFVD